MADMKPIEERYENHRALATHLKDLYTEINKLAMKKPADLITPLIARKINHVIVRVKEQVGDDEFLDAIETMPVEGQLNRYDEVLIVTAELRSAINRQWASEDYSEYRERQGIALHLDGRSYDSQTFG